MNDSVRDATVRERKDAPCAIPGEGVDMCDARRARMLLRHREAGYSIGLAIKQGARRYLLLMLLCALFSYVAILLRAIPLMWLVVGMVLGTLLRDVAWYRTIKKTWSFSEKITDWERVKQIAEEPT